MNITPLDFIVIMLSSWVFIGIPIFEAFRRYYLKPKKAEAIAKASLPEDASEEKIKTQKETVERWLKKRG